MHIQKFSFYRVGFFILFLTISTITYSEKVSAVTATSEPQLRSLAGGLKFTNADIITGQLSGQTITFKKATVENGATSATVYRATNLDCDGRQATVTKVASNSLTSSVDEIVLNAQYRDGDSCKNAPALKTNIATANFDENKAKPTTGTNQEDEEGEDLCDLDWGTPLSWIICPLVEIGSSFTDTVMNNFVFPFLSSTPVSTDRESGVYKAWQQFRILGNIVLVGSMIAVVYVQTRGDR